MKTIKHHFALCLSNEDYDASLIRGKIYAVLPDRRAAKDDLLRVIDEDTTCSPLNCLCWWISFPKWKRNFWRLLPLRN